MERVDEALLKQVDSFIESTFVGHDPSLTAALCDADSAGLPPIHVSPSQGKLLYLIAKIANASRVLELGTLGGYSTIWLARAVAPGGKVITLECNPHHADIARRNIDRACVSGVVEVREGKAADTLRKMVTAGDSPFDVIFIDADKPSYLEYLQFTLKLSRPGTVVLADNLIRNGKIFDIDADDENARGARAYNEAIASEPALDSLILPVFRDKIDGLGISLVRGKARG